MLRYSHPSPARSASDGFTTSGRWRSRLVTSVLTLCQRMTPSTNVDNWDAAKARICNVVRDLGLRSFRWQNTASTGIRKVRIASDLGLSVRATGEILTHRCHPTALYDVAAKYTGNPRLWIRLLMTFVVLGLTAPATVAADLKAGAAKVDITPPIGFPMWGYGARHDTPSDGVLDPLHARALVLAVGDTKMAIVSLDLGRAPTRDSTAAIRAKVKDAGIATIFLVASHTHHGPVLELSNWPRAGKTYNAQLEEKLIGVILEANRSLRPARLGIASNEAPFNRNRHSKLDERPVDRELLVMRIEDLDGKPIVHAVNFAAHPTMHSFTINKFSADFPAPWRLSWKMRRMERLVFFCKARPATYRPTPDRSAGRKSSARRSVATS